MPDICLHQPPSSPITSTRTSPLPSFPLSGKTALITGANHGIGRSLAFAFARAGCFVACVSHSLPSLPLDPVCSSSSSSSSSFSSSSSSSSNPNPTTATLINTSMSLSFPPDMHATGTLCKDRARDFIYDITAPSSFAQLERDILKWVNQPVTILVNNAGIARVEAVEYQTAATEPQKMETWNKVIATNLTGPVALTYQFLPGMLAAAAAGDGCIMSVGSRNAVVPVPFMAAYNVSKIGLLKFHETLEREVGGGTHRGVRNFYVVPGNISGTGILKREGSVDERSYRESERVRQMVERIEDAGKKGDNAATRAQEFAEVCVRLASMGKDAEILSGRYVDAERDVEALLEDAKKGKESKICKMGLYQLKIDRL
ncbi:NAD(P)-binding protein [Neurospora crassa]|uniref:Short-chain dehydrogenase/reductase SDR n=2 Tax=Neurospora crassa TaxID=5141 RepID=Q1K648_NEUCR|nr:short-chain dehydrogenase/reductase SDR [Neurospora crassa OR74A]EAA29026.1 short-chain dehydrogenase/reductase SDR [Neurospora crassa OR74A]KHE85041.1 NAD(P)-binding protein [Neurospora crassa]CAC28569.1 conserved hypothetical protein [Neurospora crassa]|eukprot:XP_958262.1 short-chain dehydrogenase/reductase SDR [Neurospora crassa OR74A]